MDNKLKHLELVQGVINRMAGNSFMLKGWAVTLVVGVFSLSDLNTDKIYFIIAYIPIIIFWLLDTYYLQQERLYRSLYNKVRKTEEQHIDFDLNVTYQEFIGNNNTYFECLYSLTEIGFYIPLALICAIVIIITNI